MSYRDAIADIAMKPEGAARYAAALAWAERIATVWDDVPLGDLLGLDSGLNADVSIYCRTTRAYNVLRSCELQNATQLLIRTVGDLWNLRQCGAKTVQDILQALLVVAASTSDRGRQASVGPSDTIDDWRSRQEHWADHMPAASSISRVGGNAIADIAEKPSTLRHAAAAAWACRLAATEDRSPLREVLGVPGFLHADVSYHCDTTRAYNILRDSELTNLAALLEWSVPDLRALRQCGIKTITDILQAVLIAASEELEGATSGSPVPAKPELSGVACATACETVNLESAPTAHDVPRLISQWAAELDRREALIARHRLLRDRTLDDLGNDFRISRERVRQIERNLRESLASWRRREAPSAALLDLDREIRQAVTTVASEQRLLAQLPVLAAAIPGLGCQVVDLISTLLPGIARQSGWMAIEPLADLQDQTVAAALAAADSPAGSAMECRVEAIRERLCLTKAEWSRWLAYCGLRTVGGAVVRSGAGVAEVAAALLREAGHPMSAEDIAAELSAESVRTVRNRLLSDPRIVRVAPNLYGLPEWRLESYEGIREEIIQRIDRGGGRVEVQKLVDELVNQFGVSPNSVHSYASGREFVRKAGWLYLAGDQPTNTGRSSHRHDIPAATRRCYFRDGRWWLRVDVGADELRGSGFAVPTGVMRLFQVAEGTERTFNAEGTTVRISWERNQPAFGSVRSLLVALQAEPGDALWLTPASRGHVDARLARAQRAGGLGVIAHLTGADYAEDTELLRKRVAEAAGLPADKSWHALAQVLRVRGDVNLAELIEGTFPAAPGATPTLEEFLAALRGQQ